MITQADIEARLEQLKKRKKIQPKDYREFMPATLGFQPDDTSMYDSQLGNLEQRGKNATNLARVKAQNSRDYQIMREEQEEARRAQRRLQQVKKAQPKFEVDFKPGKNQGRNYGGKYEGQRNFGKRWGRDNTPEVSDIKTLRPNAPITGVNWRGHSFQVNSQVADIFVAFLDDLWKTGYRPVSIGGHNDRNIAGTNTPSLHSYGFAIDIDPHKNPVQHGSNNHALPRNVAALAAKYGLKWGGSWNSYKDPMHFSVAYGGRE